MAEGSDPTPPLGVLGGRIASLFWGLAGAAAKGWGWTPIRCILPSERLQVTAVSEGHRE